MKSKPTINNSLTKEAISARFDYAVRTIIKYRRKGCKTASSIGKIIDMAQQNFSKIADGSQGPTMVHIAKLCDYFDINDSYILRGKGNLEEMMPITARIDELEIKVNELEKIVSVVIKQQKK